MSLYVQDSPGSFIPATDDQVVEAALHFTDRLMRRGPALTESRAVKQYLTIRFSRLEHEVFAVIFLDARQRVIEVEEMFRGTIDGAQVHPREVVKATLRHNAHAVILVHNHPSGIPEPSTADEFLTRRLREALALIDVRVLDHFIVGHDFVESFADRGLL